MSIDPLGIPGQPPGAALAGIGADQLLLLGVAPAQVALAWVYAQQDRLGVPVVPIPGTKRIKWLEQNVAALDVTLTADELAILDPLASQVATPATNRAAAVPSCSTAHRAAAGPVTLELSWPLDQSLPPFPCPLPWSFL